MTQRGFGAWWCPVANCSLDNAAPLALRAEAAPAGQSTPLPGSDPDLGLLRRAQQGDDAAFEELMARYSSLFHALAFFLLGRASDVEDVVQETFLAAYENLRSFQARSSVKTWLSGILLNRAAHCRRSWRIGKAARTISLSESTRAFLAGAAAPSPLAASEVKLDVAAMLQTLQPEHRDIVVLREMDGLSYQEIAAALDLPVGTVESRLYRARQELRARLKDYGD